LQVMYYIRHVRQAGSLAHGLTQGHRALSICKCTVLEGPTGWAKLNGATHFNSL